MMSHYLFLYGTLLPNHAPSELAPAVARLRRLGEGTVRGHLYDLGAYPGAVLDALASAHIHGTVFELPDDEELLCALDLYEDFHSGNVESSLFVRSLQPVTLANGEIVQCWMYVYNRDASGARRILSGRYPDI
jgi:gamma-glutamylcyclotransferase (GGCT)/AIG2-like uncharacterized protein YtfP